MHKFLLSDIQRIKETLLFTKSYKSFKQQPSERNN